MDLLPSCHRFEEQDIQEGADRRNLLSAGVAAIHKPNLRLVRYAMDWPEATDPNATLLISNQYSTDLLTGNLAGAQSAKVPTFRPYTFPAPVRAGQLLEQAVYRMLNSTPGNTTP